MKSNKNLSEKKLLMQASLYLQTTESLVKDIRQEFKNGKEVDILNVINNGNTPIESDCCTEEQG